MLRLEAVSENCSGHQCFHLRSVFFTGPPSQILKAWRDGKVQLLISSSILEEYYRVGTELASQFRGVDLIPFLELLIVQAEMILAPALPQVIHEDPSDDKFLEAAIAGKATHIISGDKHLLKLLEFQGIQILKPKVLCKNKSGGK